LARRGNGVGDSELPVNQRRRGHDVTKAKWAGTIERVRRLQPEIGIRAAPAHADFSRRGVVRDVEPWQWTRQAEEFQRVVVTTDVADAQGHDENDVGPRRHAEGEGYGTVPAGVAQII